VEPLLSVNKTEIPWTRVPEGIAMKIRTKVWIDDDCDEIIFGSGRLYMLEAIDRLGSMNKAAKSLRMSYRAMWGRIKCTEDRMGAKLLISRSGGGKGNGSMLTPTGRELLQKYKVLKETIIRVADETFEEVFGDTIRHEK
jgi:molybdate transport system regulatory protein